MSDELVKRYRELQSHIGGCSDGHCVIKKPKGMHTNGGCQCLMHLKLHEASRIGHLLKYAQKMADRIEALDAQLAEAEARAIRLAEVVRDEAAEARDYLADAIGASPMSSIHNALSEYRNCIRAIDPRALLEQMKEKE